jgi:outer membrane lipoprotein-sorting protein
MVQRSVAIVIGALLVAAAGATAVAQTVPLPLPAPLPKSGANPGISNPASAVQLPRPPGSVPQLPAGQAAPPRTIEEAAKVNPVIPATKPDVQPGEATAFDAQQRGLIEKVNTYLSTVQMLTGKFVQVGPDGKRTEGEFYLQKPGKIRFEYDPPSPIELIADGQSVVVRDRKLATQDLYPLSQTPLRFLLSSKIDLLRDTNLVAVYADDVFITVVIEEKQVVLGTNRLMIMFGAKDMQLRQWTVTDPQGYDTTVAVYNLDTTKKLDPSLFKIDYTRYPN